MFDYFSFADGVLPDNKAPSGHEFQTKDLECHLNKYTVHADKTVTVSWFYDGPPIQPLNFSADVYSHEFMYDNPKDILNRKYLGVKFQEYRVVIKDSKLVHVEKLYESGYDTTESREAKDPE